MGVDLSERACKCVRVFVNVERKRREEEEGGEEEGVSISTVLPVSSRFTHTPTLHGTVLLSLLLNGHFCGSV